MMEKIPVFVISGKDPMEAPGGYAAYAHNLCKVIKDLGYPVYIIALGEKNSVKHTPLGVLHIVSNSIANNIPFIALVQMAALPFYSYSFAKRIEKIIDDKHLGLFIVWGMGPWGFAGVLLKKKFKQRIIFTSSYFTTFLHEMAGSVKAIRIEDYGLLIKIKYVLVFTFFGSIFAILEKKLVQATDFLITHYRSTEDILNKEFNITKKKFKRITYFTEIFSRNIDKKIATKIDKHPLIITICRQDPRKGINFLIHAVKLLIDSGFIVHCVIVGTGNMLKLNKNLANKLGVSDYIQFLGFVNDFSSLLKKADLFVFPAVEEGSGSLSVLEAMSVGKPMVVTDCDGIPEDIRHLKSGIVVDKMDAAALARGIKKLLTDKNLSFTLGSNARNEYKKKFSLELMTKDIEKVVKQYEKFIAK